MIRNEALLLVLFISDIVQTDDAGNIRSGPDITLGHHDLRK